MALTFRRNSLSTTQSGHALGEYKSKSLQCIPKTIRTITNNRHNASFKYYFRRARDFGFFPCRFCLCGSRCMFWSLQQCS